MATDTLTKYLRLRSEQTNKRLGANEVELDKRGMWVNLFDRHFSNTQRGDLHPFEPAIKATQHDKSFMRIGVLVEDGEFLDREGLIETCAVIEPSIWLAPYEGV